MFEDDIMTISQGKFINFIIIRTLDTIIAPATAQNDCSFSSGGGNYTCAIFIGIILGFAIYIQIIIAVTAIAMKQTSIFRSFTLKI